MKINDSVKKPVGLTTEKTEAKSGKSSGVVGAVSSSSESVTLSSMSSQLKSLESSGEVYDAGKVEAIKTAIRDGQFKVDSEKVADGLISTVKDLLNNK